MTLNIYRGGKIEKTYTAEAYDLMFGVLEDVADAVKIDEMKNGSDEELVKMTANLVVRSMGTVHDLLKDVFEGITEEEIRRTKVIEIATVLVQIIKYTIEQMRKGISGKN